MYFLDNFLKVLSGIMQIVLLAAGGYFFYRTRVIREEVISSLSALVVNLFLPALIFAHMLKNFNGTIAASCWIYLPLGAFICLSGFLLARLWLRVSLRTAGRKEFIGLLTFQNCGYLPLVLVTAVFPPEQANILFTDIFLFIQGFNLVFWTAGVHYLSGNGKGRLLWKRIINPPLIALLAGAFFVFSKTARWLPVPVISTVNMLGACTLPLALIVLGAVLSSCPPEKFRQQKKFLREVITGKMIVMPLLALAIIAIFRLPFYLGLVILIEAAMPSAITLSVISYDESPSCSLISQGVLATHLSGMITVPFFLALYRIFN